MDKTKSSLFYLSEQQASERWAACEFCPQRVGRRCKQLGRPPVLVWLRRDTAALRRSYESRGELVDGEPGVRGRTVEELQQMAQRHYQAYPWCKLELDIEQIARAVEPFDPARILGAAGTGSRRREGG